MQAEFASERAIGSTVNRLGVSLFWVAEMVHPSQFPIFLSAFSSFFSLTPPEDLVQGGAHIAEAVRESKFHEALRNDPLAVEHEMREIPKC